MGGPGPGYPMMLGYPMMAPPQLAQVGPLLMPGTGSIRSVHSVPMLNHHTWDGEPCPVHHGHAHGHGPMVPLAALYGESLVVVVVPVVTDSVLLCQVCPATPPLCHWPTPSRPQ